MDDVDDEGMLSKPLGGRNDALGFAGSRCGSSGLFYDLSIG